MRQKRLKSILTCVLAICMVFGTQSVALAAETDSNAVQTDVTDDAADKTSDIADKASGTAKTDDVEAIDDVDMDTTGENDVNKKTENETIKSKRSAAPANADDEIDTLSFDDTISGNCGAEGNEENVTWKLEQNNDDNDNLTYTLTISGTGAMADYASGGASPWNDMETSITKVIITEGVTSIGDRAFFGCSNMVSIELPSTLSRIGQNAFHTCTSLSTLNIGASVTGLAATGFSGEMVISSDNVNYAGVEKWVYKLNNTEHTAALWYIEKESRNKQEITIPKNIEWQGEQYTVTAIGDTSVDNYIFDGATTLQNVKLPDSVTEIGKSTFHSCSALKEIDISNVTLIGTQAFYNCSSLNNVTLNNTVTKIPDNLFRNCSSLTNVNLPDSLTTIGRYAFSGSGITEINIPKNVTAIGDFAFLNCLSLTSVTGGEGLQSLMSSSQQHGDVFGGCSKLETIDLIGTSDLIIPANTFGTNTNQSPIKLFKLENGSFASGFTFVNKNKLEEVWLGNVVIPNDLFKNQTALKNVELIGVDLIGKNAFSGCATLEKVHILGENSVTIGNYAFSNCTNIKGVIINAKNITLGGAVINADKAIEVLDLSSAESIILNSTTPIAINRTGANPNVVCYISSASNQAVISNQFTANTVYFAVTNGGTFADNTRFSANTLATPTKANYKFLGWYDNEACSGTAVTTIEKGKTYYAGWEDKTATTISFSDSLSLDLSKTYDGKEVSISASDYTVTGNDRKVTFAYQTKDGNDWKDLTSAPAGAGEYRVKAMAAEDDTYASAETDWKEFSISKADQQISFAASTLEVHINNVTAANTLNYTGDGTVTYTSSKEGVAAVDAVTGQVTIKGVGQATIIATASETGNYCETTDCYVLIVTAHKWGAWETVTSPNCTDKGSQKRTCSICDAVETKILDENGHDWESDYTIDQKATCTTNGSKSIHCKNCALTKDITVIPALGHKGELSGAKDATCIAEGYTGDTICSVCGVTLEKGKAIPKTDHSYKDGKCTVCKATDPNYVSKADIAAGTMALNKKILTKWSGNSLKVNWGKVSKADGYEVYAAKCGQSYQKVKTVTGNKTLTYTVKKIGGKKLNAKSSYKIKVKAYRTVNGKKVYTGTSYDLHIAGKSNKTHTDPKSVKATPKNVTLKKGKSKKLSVKVTKKYSSRKLLTTAHCAKLRYFSTDTKVAAVTSGGTIKAKAKGSCTIYALGANGVKTTVKVTVK